MTGYCIGIQNVKPLRGLVKPLGACGCETCVRCEDQACCADFGCSCVQLQRTTEWRTRRISTALAVMHNTTTYCLVRSCTKKRARRGGSAGQPSDRMHTITHFERMMSVTLAITICGRERSISSVSRAQECHTTALPTEAHL